ncbi:MAG: hypothetical protein CMJ46_11775 [Planctomyces sp.]|nr:hypothetical protein [Planctomyces sp.]
MEDLYFYAMIIGVTLITIQVVLSMVGFVGDLEFADVSDPDLDFDTGDSDWGGKLLGVLSFRAIVIAIAVFGFIGMAATKQFPDAEPRNFILAFCSGLGTLYLVGWLIQSLYKVRYDGTANIKKAVGEQGTVYLKIPGNNSGRGKVTVNLQGRSMEYEAITEQDEIQTGATVIVTSVHSPGVLEVTLVEAIQTQTPEETT